MANSICLSLYYVSCNSQHILKPFQCLHYYNNKMLQEYNQGRKW